MIFVVKSPEEILDISLEKMPVNKFGHYSMLISYIDLYYILDETEKARELTSELKTVLQENLVYFSQFDETNIEIVFINDVSAPQTFKKKAPIKIPST